MADPGYIVDGVLTDGEAWVGIAHASLSLPAATVTWTSTDDGQTGDFSQYMDLVVVTYCQSDTETAAFMRFNNDSASNYSRQELYGDGGSVGAGSSSTSSYAVLFYMPRTSDGANDFGAAVMHLFDINSGKYKSALSQYATDKDGSGYVGFVAGTWRSQAAITEIDVTMGGNFVAGSTFSLFGVLPRMVA